MQHFYIYMYMYIYMFQHSAKSLFDLWYFLLRWPHTPDHKPFKRHHCQASHFCWREQDSHNTRDYIP